MGGSLALHQTDGDAPIASPCSPAGSDDGENRADASWFLFKSEARYKLSVAGKSLTAMLTVEGKVWRSVRWSEVPDSFLAGTSGDFRKLLVPAKKESGTSAPLKRIPVGQIKRAEDSRWTLNLLRALFTPFVRFRDLRDEPTVKIILHSCSRACAVRWAAVFVPDVLAFASVVRHIHRGNIWIGLLTAAEDESISETRLTPTCRFTTT